MSEYLSREGKVRKVYCVLEGEELWDDLWNKKVEAPESCRQRITGNEATTGSSTADSENPQEVLTALGFKEIDATKEIYE